MNFILTGIELENFKSYGEKQYIDISDLTVLLGANSSGKSSVLQALLLIKQTMECNSSDIQLLLSGKYVALGEFKDVLNDKNNNKFSISVELSKQNADERMENGDKYKITWDFIEDDKKKVILERVYIRFEEKKVCLKREKSNRYCFVIDNHNTVIMTELNNLRMAKGLILKYDEKFNRLFIDFLRAIKVFFLGKKVNSIPYNEVASIRLIPDFYMDLLVDERAIDEINSDKKKFADSLVELIEEYSCYQNTSGLEYYPLSSDIRKKCVYSVINKNEDLSELKKIYRDYKNKFDNYKITPGDLSTFTGEKRIGTFGFQTSADKNKNTDIDLYYWVSKFYGEFASIIRKVFFVGPIRENPKGLYSIGFEQEPKYVGPTGQFFASVLLHENKIREYIFPNGEKDRTCLWEALDEWARHLNIASSIKVAHSTSFGISVSVADTQDKQSDIMNVGIGTSQVLPVLITGLLSEEGEELIFEQPELHLHPFSQSRLADFFVELIKNGRKIIVETHSEAFILRLRYHLLVGHCGNDSIAINFFNNNGGTKVEKCIINGYANIMYPDGFRDETQELLNDLLQASMLKRD